MVSCRKEHYGIATIAFLAEMSTGLSLEVYSQMVILMYSAHFYLISSYANRFIDWNYFIKDTRTCGAFRDNDKT
jgi:hypothetical protein